MSNEDFSYVIYKPKAVYLGRKISLINEKIVLDIARDKNIHAFKMDFNGDSRKYKKSRLAHGA